MKKLLFAIAAVAIITVSAFVLPLNSGNVGGSQYSGVSYDVVYHEWFGDSSDRPDIQDSQFTADSISLNPVQYTYYIKDTQNGYKVYILGDGNSFKLGSSDNDPVQYYYVTNEITSADKPQAARNNEMTPLALTLPGLYDSNGNRLDTPMLYAARYASFYDSDVQEAEFFTAPDTTNVSSTEGEVTWISGPEYVTMSVPITDNLIDLGGRKHTIVTDSDGNITDFTMWSVSRNLGAMFMDNGTEYAVYYMNDYLHVVRSEYGSSDEEGESFYIGRINFQTSGTSNYYYQSFSIGNTNYTAVISKYQQVTIVYDDGNDTPVPMTGRTLLYELEYNNCTTYPPLMYARVVDGTLTVTTEPAVMYVASFKNNYSTSNIYFLSNLSVNPRMGSNTRYGGQDPGAALEYGSSKAGTFGTSDINNAKTFKATGIQSVVSCGGAFDPDDSGSFTVDGVTYTATFSADGKNVTSLSYQDGGGSTSMISPAVAGENLFMIGGTVYLLDVGSYSSTAQLVGAKLGDSGYSFTTSGYFELALNAYFCSSSSAIVGNLVECGSSIALEASFDGSSKTATVFAPSGSTVEIDGSAVPVNTDSFIIDGDLYVAAISGGSIESLQRNGSASGIAVSSNTFAIDGVTYAATVSSGSVTAIVADSPDAVVMLGHSAVINLSNGSGGEVLQKDVSIEVSMDGNSVEKTLSIENHSFNAQDASDPYTRTVTYYGKIASTEYNPQAWDYSNKWFDIVTYAPGLTYVFTGWSYATGFDSLGNPIGQTEAHFPGEVMTLEQIEAATGPDGKIHVYATWEPLNALYIVQANSTWVNNGLNNKTASWTFASGSILEDGSAYTNILLVGDGVVLTMMESDQQNDYQKTKNVLPSGSPMTIRSVPGGTGTLSSTTGGDQYTFVMKDDMFIDNINFFVADQSGNTNHGANHSGVYARGNMLIMGEGVNTQNSNDRSNYTYNHYPSLSGGSYQQSISHISVEYVSGTNFRILESDLDKSRIYSIVDNQFTLKFTMEWNSENGWHREYSSSSSETVSEADGWVIIGISYSTSDNYLCEDGVPVVYFTNNYLPIKPSDSLSNLGVYRNPGDPVDRRDTISSALIVFSGIYNNINGGCNDSVLDGSTYVVLRGHTDTSDRPESLKGCTILDTLNGGSASKSNKMNIITGSTHVYCVGLYMSGDIYQEKLVKAAGGYSRYPSVLTGINESSMASGGTLGYGGTHYVYGDTNTYLSGETVMWDITGAGRQVSCIVGGNVNVDVSGKATVRNTLAGLTSDANAKTSRISLCSGVYISISDSSTVSHVYGGGYDVWDSAVYPTTLSGRISIQMSGGTVGYIYGGGYRGDIGSPESAFEEINITVSGGTVLGDVYGGGCGGLDKVKRSTSGSNEGVVTTAGSAVNDTTGRSNVYAHRVNVSIVGGTVMGSVYGGGMSVPVVERLGTVSWSVGNTGAYKLVLQDDVAQVVIVSDQNAITYDGITVNILDGADVRGGVYGGGRGFLALEDGTLYEYGSEGLRLLYTMQILDPGFDGILHIPWDSGVYDSNGDVTSSTFRMMSDDNLSSLASVTPDSASSKVRLLDGRTFTVKNGPSIGDYAKYTADLSGEQAVSIYGTLPPYAKVSGIGSDTYNVYSDNGAVTYIEKVGDSGWSLDSYSGIFAVSNESGIFSMDISVSGGSMASPGSRVTVTPVTGRTLTDLQVYDDKLVATIRQNSVDIEYTVDFNLVGNTVNGYTITFTDNYNRYNEYTRTGITSKYTCGSYEWTTGSNGNMLSSFTCKQNGANVPVTIAKDYVVIGGVECRMTVGGGVLTKIEFPGSATPCTGSAVSVGGHAVSFADGVVTVDGVDYFVGTTSSNLYLVEYFLEDVPVSDNTFTIGGIGFTATAKKFSYAGYGAVDGNIRVNVSSSEIGEDVYGGGRRSNVSGDSTVVNVSGSTVHGSVYGGCAGASASVDPEKIHGTSTSGSIEVNIGDSITTIFDDFYVGDLVVTGSDGSYQFSTGDTEYSATVSSGGDVTVSSGGTPVGLGAAFMVNGEEFMTFLMDNAIYAGTVMVTHELFADLTEVRLYLGSEACYLEFSGGALTDVVIGGEAHDFNAKQEFIHNGSTYRVMAEGVGFGLIGQEGSPSVTFIDYSFRLAGASYTVSVSGGSVSQVSAGGSAVQFTGRTLHSGMSTYILRTDGTGLSVSAADIYSIPVFEEGTSIVIGMVEVGKILWPYVTAKDTNNTYVHTAPMAGNVFRVSQPVKSWADGGSLSANEDRAMEGAYGFDGRMILVYDYRSPYGSYPHTMYYYGLSYSVAYELERVMGKPAGTTVTTSRIEGIGFALTAYSTTDVNASFEAGSGGTQSTVVDGSVYGGGKNGTVATKTGFFFPAGVMVNDRANIIVVNGPDEYVLNVVKDNGTYKLATGDYVFDSESRRYVLENGGDGGYTVDIVQLTGCLSVEGIRADTVGGSDGFRIFVYSDTGYELSVYKGTENTFGVAVVNKEGSTHKVAVDGSNTYNDMPGYSSFVYFYDGPGTHVFRIQNGPAVSATFDANGNLTLQTSDEHGEPIPYSNSEYGLVAVTKALFFTDRVEGDSQCSVNSRKIINVPLTTTVYGAHAECSLIIHCYGSPNYDGTKYAAMIAGGDGLMLDSSLDYSTKLYEPEASHQTLYCSHTTIDDRMYIVVSQEDPFIGASEIAPTVFKDINITIGSMNGSSTLIGGNVHGGGEGEPGVVTNWGQRFVTVTGSEVEIVGSVFGGSRNGDDNGSTDTPTAYVQTLSSGLEMERRAVLVIQGASGTVYLKDPEEYDVDGNRFYSAESENGVCTFEVKIGRAYAVYVGGTDDSDCRGEVVTDFSTSPSLTGGLTATVGDILLTNVATSLSSDGGFTFTSASTSHAGFATGVVYQVYTGSSGDRTLAGYYKALPYEDIAINGDQRGYAVRLYESYVTVSSGYVGDSVYGGGLRSMLYGGTHIVIKGTATIDKSVYGGSDIGMTAEELATQSGIKALTTGGSSITVLGVRGAYIGNSVIGSGNSCQVLGERMMYLDTLVGIQDGSYRSDIIVDPYEIRIKDSGGSSLNVLSNVMVVIDGKYYVLHQDDGILNRLTWTEGNKSTTIPVYEFGDGYAFDIGGETYYVEMVMMPHNTYTCLDQYSTYKIYQDDMYIGSLSCTSGRWEYYDGADCPTHQNGMSPVKIQSLSTSSFRYSGNIGEITLTLESVDGVDYEKEGNVYTFKGMDPTEAYDLYVDNEMVGILDYDKDSPDFRGWMWAYLAEGLDYELTSIDSATVTIDFDGSSVVDAGLKCEGDSTLEEYYMRSVQNATRLIFVNCFIGLSGRGDALSLDISDSYSLAHIDNVMLTSETFITFDAKTYGIGNFGSYILAYCDEPVTNPLAYGIRADHVAFDVGHDPNHYRTYFPTTADEPLNEILDNAGIILNILLTDDTYGVVTGYTVLDTTHQGAFAYGDTSSTGGFVLYEMSDDEYVPLDIADKGNSRCWYIGKIEVTTITYKASITAIDGETEASVLIYLPYTADNENADPNHFVYRYYVEDVHDLGMFSLVQGTPSSEDEFKLVLGAASVGSSRLTFHDGDGHIVSEGVVTGAQVVSGSTVYQFEIPQAGEYVLTIGSATYACTFEHIHSDNWSIEPTPSRAPSYDTAAAVLTVETSNEEATMTLNGTSVHYVRQNDYMLTGVPSGTYSLVVGGESYGYFTTVAGTKSLEDGASVTVTSSGGGTYSVRVNGVPGVPELHKTDAGSAGTLLLIKLEHFSDIDHTSNVANVSLFLNEMQDDTLLGIVEVDLAIYTESKDTDFPQDKNSVVWVQDGTGNAVSIIPRGFFDQEVRIVGISDHANDTHGNTFPSGWLANNPGLDVTFGPVESFDGTDGWEEGEEPVHLVRDGVFDSGLLGTHINVLSGAYMGSLDLVIEGWTDESFEDLGDLYVTVQVGDDPEDVITLRFTVLENTERDFTTLNGTVYEVNTVIPIPDALVICFYKMNGDWYTLDGVVTDENGKYSVDIPKAAVTSFLLTTHDGYYDAYPDWNGFEDMITYMIPKGDYIVTFHSRNGMSETEVQMFVIGSSALLKDNRFSNAGYLFVGWCLESGGDDVDYYDEEYVTPAGNMDLYAVYVLSVHKAYRDVY